MKKLLNSTAKKIALCYVLYHILGIAVYFTTQSYFFLVWNLFLSIVPLFFARLLERSLGKRHWSIICVLSLFWLLFYPNAPYMVTDLMHLRWLRFDSADTVQNILSWIRLLYLALGVLLGGLAGNLSLYKVHRLLSLHWGRWKARFCLAVIFLLSGYAIYIGRFLRLNSWDIVRPLHLVRTLLNGFDRFTIPFSFLLALYAFASYGIFCVFFTSRTADTADSGLDHNRHP